MKACGDTIILKPIRMEKKTESGVIVRQDFKRHDSALSVGQVFSIGPLAFTAEMSHEKEYGTDLEKPRVGDYVLTAKYAGYEVEFDNEEFKLVLAADINAVITEEEVNQLKKWRVKARE